MIHVRLHTILDASDLAEECSGVFSRIGGDSPGGLGESSPAAAHGGVAELSELLFVVQTSGQGVLGELSPNGVVQGQAGELLSARQARRAVAP